MPKARIEVWDRSNTTKLGEGWVTDDDGRQRNVDDIDPIGDKLNESGGGGITIQEDHPAAEVAVPGNVVRLCADTTPLFAITIRDRDHVTVARRQRDRTITLDGDGLLEQWRKAVVDPWSRGRPISLDRIWNWAAPRGFDDSSWNTTNYQQTRTSQPLWPEAYPMAPIYAAQLWTRPDDTEQPVGSTLWRRTVPFDEPADVAVYQACDDDADMWSSGVVLNRNSTVYPDTSGWQKTWREVPPCDAGDVVFAFEAYNRGGPAFFMASAFTVVNGVVAEPIFSTGDGEWRWLDYPSPKPGFTAPQIVQMLLEEAQARKSPEMPDGELAGWSLDIHGVHPEIEEFSCRVGTNYREVLDQIAAAHADIAADTHGLVLHLWPKGGRDTAPGVDLESASIDSLSIVDGDDVVTAVQGVWSDGVTWVERDDHPTLGRCEASLQLGSVTSVEAATAILNAHLDANATPSRSIVGEFEDVTGAVAGVDYQVGDTVTLNGESVRCVGMTWTVSRAGDLVPHPEFDTVSNVRRREFLRSIDRMTAKYDSPASAPILSSKPLLVSGHPSTGEWSWSWGNIDDLEDDERDGQIKRPDTVKRLWRVSVEIKPEDLPDAYGDTTIELLKNGAVLNSLYDVTIDTVTARAEMWIWAYEVITPGDRISVRGKAGEWGGHEDGVVTVSYCDPV